MGRYTVREAVLYGSRARQTHTPESDADIATVLDGERGNRTWIGRDLAGIAFDVLIEAGILVEALPLWADEFERPDASGNPALSHAIRRDGVPVISRS